MKNRNHNIRFSTEKPDEIRAWERLHSDEVRSAFKSQNRFVIEAINDYYDRHMAKSKDPYLETREKEDEFADRIVETVERKVISNLPMLFGMYMAQMQSLSLSVPMGSVQPQILAKNMNQEPETAGTEMSQISHELDQNREPESYDGAAELIPDNDLIDFDAF